MDNSVQNKESVAARRSNGERRQFTSLLLSAALATLVGCGTSKVGQKKEDFFTSGSRDADQRASQRMAKAEQLTGTGEGTGEKKVKKAEPAKPAAGGTGTGA